MNLNVDQIAVLSALRAAAVLRREPKTLTPDGHERWYTMPELAGDGRFAGPVTDLDLKRLASAAAGLRREGLVAGRTMHTVTRYCITGTGSLVLAAREAAAGLSDIVAIEMELDQAREDQRQARARERDAMSRLAVAIAKRSERSRS